MANGPGRIKDVGRKLRYGRALGSITEHVPEFPEWRLSGLLERPHICWEPKAVVWLSLAAGVVRPGLEASLDHSQTL